MVSDAWIICLDGDDLYVFATEAHVRGFVEPIDVGSGCYTCFDAGGRLIDLSVVNVDGTQTIRLVRGDQMIDSHAVGRIAAYLVATGLVEDRPMGTPAEVIRLAVERVGPMTG